MACGLDPTSSSSRSSISLPLRRIVCSATLTTNPQQLALLALSRPRVFRASDVPTAADDATGAEEERRYKTPDTLREAMVVCDADKKPLVLVQLLQALGGKPCIVFASSVEKVHRLTRLLQLYGSFPGRVVEFSANLPQRQRSRVLKWVRVCVCVCVWGGGGTRTGELFVAREVSYTVLALLCFAWTDSHWQGASGGVLGRCSARH